MGDEYTVLIVFLAGVVAQAALVARSLAGALGVVAIAILALGASWLYGREDPDPGFAIPVMATVLFVLVYAIFFRERLLPRLSGATLLHYTLIAAYGVLSLSWPAELAPWLFAALSVPAMVSFYVSVAPGEPGRLVKAAGYAWFLIVVTVTLGSQLAPSGLRALFEEKGFSLELSAWVFLGGMIFLHFSTNVLYLLMLLPAGEVRSSFWTRVLGPTRSASEEHWDALAERMASRGWTPLALALLAAHGLALLVNLRFRLFAPALFVNGVLAVLAVLTASPLESGPPRGA